VLLSGYPSALYDEQLGDWQHLELQVMNQAGVRTEKLWLNFIPDRVHWARFAGKNFTGRQRIKRKAESWARRYEAMPMPERLAVRPHSQPSRPPEAMGSVNKVSPRAESDDLKGQSFAIVASLTRMTRSRRGARLAPQGAVG